MTIQIDPEQERYLTDIWTQKQRELKTQLILDNDFDWTLESHHATKKPLRYIAGVDISFDKNDDSRACAALVILSYPSLQIVYRRFKNVQLTLPYIPTFLGFREADHIADLLQELKEKDPELIPDVILVDGNGYLHPRGFGLACHLGILTNLPTIGIGKNFLVIDGLGMQEVKEKHRKECPKKGDWMPLIGESKTCWGASLSSNDGGRRPLYISIGHRINLPTAIEVVKRCCIYRIPEPIRQADLGSREFLLGGNTNRQF